VLKSSTHSLSLPLFIPHLSYGTRTIPAIWWNARRRHIALDADAISELLASRYKFFPSSQCLLCKRYSILIDITLAGLGQWTITSRDQFHSGRLRAIEPGVTLSPTPVVAQHQGEIRRPLSLAIVAVEAERNSSTSKRTDRN
jgi:hypothetical protein